MTPEVAKILMDGLFHIVALVGVSLCVYAFIKGIGGGYRRGG